MEFNIYFKNVGQGDTIFLDWKESSRAKRKFALIDCNLTESGIAPVIKHIQSRRIREFEFVLMSHPHFDHFSGFSQLFDYCESYGIIIKDFMHTANLDPKYLKEILGKDFSQEKHEFRKLSLAGVNTPRKRKALEKVFERVIREEIRNFSGFIQGFTPVTGKPFKLGNGDLMLKFLSPHNLEVAEFARSCYKFGLGDEISMKENPGNNPAANLLSSLIQVYSERWGWQVILSSDTTRHSFQRVVKTEHLKGAIAGRRLLAAQVPHHGSNNNHEKAFWDAIGDKKQSPAVVSVGHGYDHPDIAVVEYFKENFHSVHATNFVGGFRDFHTGARQSSSDIISDLGLIDLPGIDFGRKAGEEDKLPDGVHCNDKHLRISMDKGQAVCRVIPPKGTRP